MSANEKTSNVPQWATQAAKEALDQLDIARDEIGTVDVGAVMRQLGEFIENMTPDAGHEAWAELHVQRRRLVDVVSAFDEAADRLRVAAPVCVPGAAGMVSLMRGEG